MRPVLSTDNMKKTEAAAAAAGTDGRELMRRVAAGICDAADWRPPVAVVCGAGNNAGDGYAAALLLHGRGVECTVFTLTERFSADGRYYYDRCVEAGVPVVPFCGKQALAGFGSILDCILGTGLHGRAEGVFAEAVKAINESGAYVVSADINSGLGSDSGLGDPCVISDLTVAAGYPKPGHFLGRAKDVIGALACADLGAEPAEQPFFIAGDSDMAHILPARPNFSHKGTYGYCALIGGSLRYSGAIRLAAMAAAAMRSGAGVVRVAAPASLCGLLVPAILESTLFPLADIGGRAVFREEELNGLLTGVRSAAFGMGIGTGSETEKMLLWLLGNYSGALVIDADGLTLLSRTGPGPLRSSGARILLTPHVGEFSRLCGLPADEVLERPVELASRYAAENGVTVLLKGPATVVADGHDVFLTDAGCPGMATAGSGDVLSGIAAAVCSYVPDMTRAALLSAWINGRAGELAQEKYGAVSMVAGDTAAEIPAVIRRLT